MSAKNNPNAIYINRLYRAPVKMVWDAWTDPAQVAQWWGPRGFSITTHSKDLRVGGTWDYTMHGPDGKNWENSTKYFEVEKYKRLVYDHGGNKTQPPLFRVEVNFIDLNGQTRMEMMMILPSPEAAQQTKKFIKQASGDSTWDRLAEYLEKDASGKEKFVINRTFHAPLNLMTKMWTDPKHFSKWLAPTGFDMQFIRVDIKSGGSSFYFMQNAEGFKMYGRANYKHVTPTRLEYTQEFCDEKENQARHPAAPTWPAVMLTTVDLIEEDSQHTRVCITWEVFGDCTATELETFIQGKAGMTMGWTGSFDKLEDYLTQV